MKTFIFCLLVFGVSGIGKRTANHPNPGGVSILSVDPAASTINWKAEKTTGTHLGTVMLLSGKLTMHCGRLATGTIMIDMKTLNVTDLSGSDKKKLENNLKGDNFFDTEKFPLARVNIISVNHQSEAARHFITILADVTLHGTTRQIVFTADVTKSTVTDFIAQANIDINRRDFNIATDNIKYDTFINNGIHFHVLLTAVEVKPQITSL